MDALWRIELLGWLRSSGRFRLAPPAETLAELERRATRELAA